MRESECSDISGSLDITPTEGKLIQFYQLKALVNSALLDLGYLFVCFHSSVKDYKVNCDFSFA